MNRFFNMLLSIVLWGILYSILGYQLGTFSQLPPLLFPTFIILGVVTGWVGLGWATLLRDNQKLRDKKNIIETSFAAASHSIEIGIFDQDQQTVYTTHPNAYSTLDELIARLSQKFEHDETFLQLMSQIDHRTRGELLLLSASQSSQGKKSGTLQFPANRCWAVRLMPFNTRLDQEPNYFALIIHDITPHLQGLKRLKEDYRSLELLIDHAPFGLFYLSSQNHIEGINQTLSRWIGLSKEDILGQPLSLIVESSFVDPVYMATFKTRENTTFRALVIRAENPLADIPNFLDISSKYGPRANPGQSPFLVCRLDTLPLEPLVDLQNSEDLGCSDTPIPAVILSPDCHILSYNPAFLNIMAERPEKTVETAEGNEGTGNAAPSLSNIAIGTAFQTLIHPSIRSEIASKLRRAFESLTPPPPFEIHFQGEKIHATVYVNRLVAQKDELQTETRLKLQFVDISEQKRLERQFIQSQKMQAVGQLAGGIAHDFNNLLTAMIGFCDLLLQRYMPNDPSYTDVMQIKQNAARAANLVRQLLAFSRQQTLQPKVINITDALAELSALLRRLIGAGIDLEMTHARDLWLIHVDPGQLEQVIINLAVNARDAMASGGTLHIRTSNFYLAKQQRIGHDLMPSGEYLLVEVLDTGCGISPEHIDLIFEPFFSTKEVGSGTGLGLSTVYGIVKQTGGFVQVESEMGIGTTFKIFLPRYVGSEEIQAPPAEPLSGDLTGEGTILLVEDEDAVRMFSARALREKGYRVIEAASGDEALEIIQKGDIPDLLVTDVVMPKMDGPTLSKKILEILPQMKAIFISGYTEDTFRKNIGLNTQIHFLPKPFTLKELASKVKEVINS